MNQSSFYYLACLSLCCLIIFPRCSWIENQKTIYNNQLKKIEEKKKHFTALYEDIGSKNLTAGLTKEEILKRYGEADDTFRSVSTTGSFDVWSYEKILTSKEELSRTIRLYFNDNILVSWSL